MKRILENRLADVNQTDGYGWAALLVAAEKGHDFVAEISTSMSERLQGRLP
jgi:hypothetical protein